MSDRIEELSKRYRENVSEERARSIGLFPIPEYPEYECRRGMLSTAIDVILTTLRYLAPATVLTIFWGQQSFLFRFLKYIDCAVRSLLFSSEEQKQEILEWLADAGPVRVDSLDVVWRHGWILCGILDSALPGACAGHPPTRLSLKHAQAIADNYLGVEPVFSRQELDLNDSISRYQEWRLINFLDKIRIALLKLTPSKINSQTNQKSMPDDTHFTLNYVARGSGLVAAQINNKVYFKIYPTAQQSLDPGDINILIHGPKNIYGTTVLPPVLGKAQLIRQNLLGLQSKSTHTDNVLPITQGTTYLRSYGKSNMSKTYYMPKTKYDIDIETEIMQDHAKVGYVATLEGTYEISITSKGQNVVGSPFKVTASKDIIGILERDSFCLEDGEEIDIVDIKTDKKVMLRIVDFVTEKMLLKENGNLEKITEEEAKHLLENDNIKNKYVEYRNDEKQEKNVAPIIKNTKESNKFYKTAQKVLTLNRVCNFLSNVQCENVSKKSNIELNNKQHIPDVVNSTFCDDKEKNKSYALSEKRDRIIIPENISVSILAEYPKPISEVKTKSMNTPNIKVEGFLDDNYNTITSDPFEDDNMSVDTVQSFNNPFLCDMTDQTYAIAKQFGSFIPNEYESNNSQNEETENANVKSFDDTQYEIISKTKNPFQEYVDIERPKTPVYKIITGDVTGRDDSVYIDPNIEESFNTNPLNDFTNPFIDQDSSHIYQEKPDFIIGAPVSLPPLINVPTSTPSSTTLTKSVSVKKSNRNIDIKFLESDKLKNERKISNSSNNSNLYSSFDSNLTEDVNITPNSSPVPSSTGHTNSSREMSPRNNTWDSAYVSIDDNHCSSESNASELSSSDILSKRKSQFSSAFSKMGPAEREIWQHDNNLKISKPFDDDIKIQKYENNAKRHEFKPIFEENEKAIKDVADMKDEINEMRMDPVTEAFAELDDIYDEIMTRSEVSSVTTTKDNQSQNLGIDYTIESNKIHVDSASEFKADVKRQTKILEGKISEIQARVTESISASRYLHVKENYEENNNENKAGVQFGDQTYTNIVSEKKKYWDEKIREIEAKSEEIKALQCKRRITLKHMRRNDSLSKRRGKKIVQNFLGTNQDECDKLSKPYARTDTFDSLNDIEVIDSEIINKNEQDSTNESEALTCFGKMTLKNKEHSLIDTFKHIKVSNDINMSTDSDDQNSNSNLHLKQELSEKVFQAFETSPKRFFGTSRKHILNKIDTFLGLPDSENDKKKIVEDVSHESGLVSSRISLFHSISQTEELPWTRRKCKSMYNIYQDSDKCIYSDTKSTLANLHIPLHTSTAKYSIDLEKEDCLKPRKDSFQDKVHSPLKEKQIKITHDFQNKSFDESIYMSKPSTYVKNTIKDLNKQNQLQNKAKNSKLKSISKSEMDIFSKVGNATVDEDLEKHKSYEELPKINVKNFISLYEDVSKSSKTSPTRTISRSNSMRSSNNLQISGSIPGTPKKYSTSVNEITMHLTLPSKTNKDEAVSLDRRRRMLSKDKSFEIFSNDSASSSLDFEVISDQDQETNRLSLSDIEIEIIEREPEINMEPVIEPQAHIEYKNRFTKAKKYFQSLEELREEKKAMKLTKHSLLSSSQSTESREEKKPRRKSNIKKSRSMPSSEIAKIWNQMQEEKEAESRKLVKISEKFNVDDLFEDVMEGRLSRQGSLRGIPHKKAVLETFKSMENVADSNLNSYELAISQLNDFAHENKIKNAQTYLSEYPYLPTTDPSKYHSRLDPNASGLITLKELKKKPRRNSVPDLRLNPTFTADL